jgi:uncharacterized membrane protein
MSDLICVAFKDMETADRALDELREMQREYLIDLEDACVAVREPSGKVHLKQAVNLVSLGATSSGLSGMLWGGLVGLLFLNPLAGMALGGAVGLGTGALAGSMSDYGIPDDYIRKMAETIEPGMSALFVLVRKVNPDKVLPELAKFQGKALRTSLTTEQERRLEDALSGIGSQAASSGPDQGLSATAADMRSIDADQQGTEAGTDAKSPTTHR